jgi:hypothetical protein
MPKYVIERDIPGLMGQAGRGPSETFVAAVVALAARRERVRTP